MRNLYKWYCGETFDEAGVLVDFETHYPETFNFAYDVIDDIAINDPERRAMVWCNPEGEEHIFSFADIKHWSDKTANFLSDQGVKRGDRVLVILRRHYQFWFVATALAKLGAIMVPATFMLKEHDLTYRLQQAGISCVIATNVGDIANVTDAVWDNCPEAVTRILVNGGGAGLATQDEYGVWRDAHGIEVGPYLSGPEGVCLLSCERPGWVDFNSGVRAASAAFTRRETRADEGMLMYFTSGTNGNPKMVLHDAGYSIAHIVTARHWHCVVSDNGLHFTIADTGWGKAVWGKYYGQWFCEAAVLVYDFDRFNGADILSLIERYGVTTLCCPPTMYRLMMQQDVDSYDLSKLVHLTTAGEALNPDLFQFWLAHTGKEIFEGFGQTETPLTVANLENSKPRPGSMGKPMPLYNLEIQREDGTRCDPGEPGEICIDVEPRPAGIMMEYYRNPTKTAEAMHGGWYHTGDMATVDEDGYLWYVGRNDDVIKSSGYRIGPFEIESVLLEHEAVRECAVTGVPDPVRGKAVKATVVLAPGFKGDEYLTKELQTWVKRKTAPYKYPRIIEYIDELPRTTNGKIRRVEIRNSDTENGTVYAGD